MSVFEVFYQPGKLFEDLQNRRWAWVLPLIVSILLVSAVYAATIHFIGMESILRQRLQGMRLTPEQMETAMTRGRSPAQRYASYAASAIVVPLTLLAISGLLAVLASMSSRQPKFHTMFSMVTLAFLPYWLIIAVMTTLVLMAAPDPPSLDISNLLATNAAAFMDKATTSKGLYSVMVSLDVLSLGLVAMLAYGFSKVTKSSFGSGLFAVGILWFVYVVGKAGISALL